jgi:ABC-type antimicrobial peptide transport system permease subunit
MPAAPQPERPAATSATHAAHHHKAAHDDAEHHSHHKPPKSPKSHIETAHAGLIGLIVFIVLGGLLLSPFIPGKTFDSFPGSSQSASSGDQSLACLKTPENVSTSEAYNSRAGSPVTWTYATTTTLHATCDGKAQTAISGHTSQFNPLGLLIDAVLALVVAIIVAKIWRKVFGTKD